MFSKVTHKFCLLLILSIILLAAVGCASSEPEQPNLPEPAAVADDSSTSEMENAPETAEDESAAEAEKVTESAAIEPLDLAPDVDVQTVASVLDRDDVFLLDVRELSEHQAGHIAGNTLIPTGSVAERLAEIPTDKEVIVYCHSGARSARVTQFLTQQGYTNVHNMLGGIVAWQNAGLAVEQ